MPLFKQTPYQANDAFIVISQIKAWKHVFNFIWEVQMIQIVSSKYFVLFFLLASHNRMMLKRENLIDS